MRTPESPPQARRWVGLRLPVALLGSIFLLELLVMQALDALPPMPRYVEAVFDSTLLSVLMLPLLYVLVLRPARQSLAALQSANDQLQEATARLKNMAAQVPGILLQVRMGSDGRATVPYASDALLAIFGIGPEQVRDGIGPLLRLVHEADAVKFRSAMEASAKQLVPLMLECRMRTVRGERWMTYHATPVDVGEATLWHGYLSDVTDRKLIEQELRVSSIAFNAQSGIMITDERGTILRVNKAFTELTGYSADEAVGRTPSLLRSGRQDKSFYERMWSAIRASGYWQGEIWNKRKSGMIYAEWLTITAVPDPDGHTTHYVGNFSDITSNPEAEAEIHRLAYYDPLTQLPNRRLLQDRLGQALAAAARSQQQGVVMFVDLDHFKAINDQHGHVAGDQVLVEVARRLRSAVRESDTVARMGGDEFVVLMEDLGSEPSKASWHATVVGEKLCQTCIQPMALGDSEVVCSASVGVCVFSGADTVDGLLRQADLAMYEAKTAGRRAVRFFDPQMQASQDQRRQMEAELRQAHELGQMFLCYQPQVGLLGEVVGAEALLRWKHPTRGLVMPLEFIPLAEECGAIVDLGRWALRAACQQLVAWSHGEETHHLVLAVNVSARQLQHRDFVDEVIAALQLSGANPARLKLELTESILVSHLEDAIAMMELLKQHGVGFSLDDFGTGYSSLSYVKRLPLTQIKIDRSFIKDISAGSNDTAIANMILALASSLGLEAVAEGVEQKAQRDCLAELGCRCFQGYLFSRPLPLDQFNDYVRLADTSLVASSANPAPPREGVT